MNTDSTSSEIADDSNGDDKLSEKLRNDKLLIDHVRSQGRVESCQERTTTPTTKKSRKWSWLLLVVAILSILGVGVSVLFLSFYVEPGPTETTIIEHRGEGSLLEPLPPAEVDRSFTIESNRPRRAVHSSFILILLVLFAAIVCVVIYIVIYIANRSKNLVSDTAPTVAQQPMQEMLKPHRGGSILALGIIGLVLLFFFGIIPSIIAWVMANRDLREMNAGAMDLSGRGMTQAGKTCGIIGVILSCIILTMFLFLSAATPLR